MENSAEHCPMAIQSTQRKRKSINKTLSAKKRICSKQQRPLVAKRDQNKEF